MIINDFNNNRIKFWSNYKNTKTITGKEKIIHQELKIGKENNSITFGKNNPTIILSTTDFYTLTKSITLYNKKLLKKSLHTQQKELSSLTTDCNLPLFTANETITNLTQYELSQKESDSLKGGLYFSIQPDKIPKLEIFTTRSFLNNLKSEETKSQI